MIGRSGNGANRRRRGRETSSSATLVGLLMAEGFSVIFLLINNFEEGEESASK